jgi:hypothetical protein
MEAPLVQTQIQIAEDPKHDGLNEVDPSLNIKDKQAQEQNGGKDVSDSFDTKAKALGIGIQATNDAKIERRFEDQPKDLVHDHIYNLTNKTKEDFKQIRMRRLAAAKKRREEGSIAYGNISDDRFCVLEGQLFGEDLKKKKAFFAKAGASYYGANGYRTGFGRRSRNVLQRSNQIEKGQGIFKEREIKDTLKGKHDVKADYAENVKDGSYTLRDYNKNKPMGAIGGHHGLNFEKVCEYKARGNYNLMFGGQRSNVSKYVAREKQKYLENNSHNSGSLSNQSGRFRGGFERRNMLNDAQKKNEAQEEHQFTIATKKRLNLESYYFDYGNNEKADALIDVGKKDPEYSEDRLDTQL